VEKFTWTLAGEGRTTTVFISKEIAMPFLPRIGDGIKLQANDADVCWCVEVSKVIHDPLTKTVEVICDCSILSLMVEEYKSDKNWRLSESGNGGVELFQEYVYGNKKVPD